MHIAHLRLGDRLTVEQLAGILGLKRRQVAALARKREIPDATRPDGYHYQYPVTPDLLDWIQWKRGQVKQRKQSVPKNPARLNSGVITLHGIRQQFDVWFNRMGRLRGILGSGREDRDEIMKEIHPFAQLHHDMIRADGSKR